MYIFPIYLIDIDCVLNFYLEEVCLLSIKTHVLELLDRTTSSHHIPYPLQYDGMRALNGFLLTLYQLNEMQRNWKRKFKASIIGLANFVPPSVLQASCFASQCSTTL